MSRFDRGRLARGRFGRGRFLGSRSRPATGGGFDLRTNYTGIDATLSANVITATAQSGVQTPTAQRVYLDPIGPGEKSVVVDASAGTLDLLTIAFNNFSVNFLDIFDLTNGTVVLNDPNTTSTITDLGGGRYRCTSTVTLEVADTAGNVRIGMTESTTLHRVTDPDGTETINIWNISGPEVSEPAGTITIDTLTYTRGTTGVAPDLATTVSSTGTTTANYTLRGVLAASSQTEAQIDASGNKFEVTAATLAGLDGSLDLSNSETAGVISAYVFDSGAPAIKSAVVTETGVTYDAVAPAFSSAVVEDAAPSNLVITLTKAAYEAGTLAPADFTLGGTYAGSISTATLTDTTTITLGLDTAVANGDTLTVAMTDGAVLVGVDAEAVATWTAESVTNNVSGALTSLTQTDQAVDTAHGSSGAKTFSAMSFGTADSDRRVVVGISTFGTVAHTVTGVIIGGVDATEIIQETMLGAADQTTSIWAASVPTGASGDVVVSFSDTVLDIGVSAYRMIRAAGFTATDTSNSTDTTGGDSTIAHDLNTDTGGCAITVSMCGNGAISTAPSGFTKDYEPDLNSSEFACFTSISGITSGESPRTMTQTFASAPLEWTACAASWS